MRCDPHTLGMRPIPLAVMVYSLSLAINVVILRRRKLKQSNNFFDTFSMKFGLGKEFEKNSTCCMR